MSIRTGNVEKELWFYLGLFSQEGYVRRRLSDMHANLPIRKLRERAFRINSCINQAKEYYEAAKSTSILTRPLLLYYGMYSLAKALIYLRNPLIDLNTLKHHGLKQPEIPDSPRKLLNSSAKLHRNGVFYHFSRFTQHNHCAISVGEEEGHYESSGIIPMTTSFEDIPVGQEFLLRELLLSIPELFDVFLITEKKNHRLYEISLELSKNISGNSKRLLTFYKKGDKRMSTKSLQRAFSEIKHNTELVTEKEDAILFDRSSREDYEKLVPQRLVESTSHGLYLLSPDISTSDMNANFIIMFMLSNVVRYKPPLWQRILGSSHKVMIEKFLFSAESKFPHLIVNELLGKIIFFGDGYVS